MISLHSAMEYWETGCTEWQAVQLRVKMARPSASFVGEIPLELKSETGGGGWFVTAQPANARPRKKTLRFTLEIAAQNHTSLHGRLSIDIGDLQKRSGGGVETTSANGRIGSREYDGVLRITPIGQSDFVKRL